MRSTLRAVFLTSPDHFRETFRECRVESTTRSDGDTRLTFIEFVHDPDPEDTAVDAIPIHMIRKREALNVEQDRHVMGLFPRETWVRLLEEAGSAVEEHPCESADPCSQGVLFVGTLNTSARLDVGCPGVARPS